MRSRQVPGVSSHWMPSATARPGDCAMRKWIFLVLLAGVAIGGWFAMDLIPQPPAPWDGQVNRYHLRITEEGKRAEVEGDIWLSGNMLSMFSVAPLPELPNGQASLVENLKVTDSSGRELGLKDLGYGDFGIKGRQRVKFSYGVRLEHDRHTWPAGNEEVGYHTDEGVMLVGASLFFADGAEQMQGPIELTVDLPEGWRAVTPWQRKGEGNHFVMDARRELLSNALFFGTIDSETLEIGGVEITLALGKRYLPAKQMFVDLLRTQMNSYLQLFGGPPRASRYLIVINEHESGDGGAFVGSFSQYIAGDADASNRVIWGYVMAHELLHFWNGLSIIPLDHREEWFKEGVTDYLTIVTLARNGLLDQNLLFKRLENVPRRYLIARAAQGLRMSVRDAGKDKQPNRQLVYGGGSLAAMALDVELRERSGDKVGLPELMAALHQEFGKGDRKYTMEDIAATAQRLSGHDFRPFLANAVESTGYFDIRPALRGLGLRMDSFVEEMFISQEPTATVEQRARFEAVFGSAAAQAATGADEPAAAQEPGGDNNEPESGTRDASAMSGE